MTDARTGPRWDPAQYLRHADHRARPLRELLARVPELPGGARPRVADLGCGPGGPTREIAARWPAGHVTGYDNSPQMLAAAREHASAPGDGWAGGGRVDFAAADLATWCPETAYDLLFSNALLQWLPGHTGLFPDWVAALPAGGVLAFQVPGNFDAPSHTVLHELRTSPRWADRLGAPARAGSVLDPAGYHAALAPLGCDVDAWETTYLHVLRGPDPVLDWVKGTALRPVLTLLEDDGAAREAFLAEYRDALRDAYPPQPDGTTRFPFRRIFVVAVKR